MVSDQSGSNDESLRPDLQELTTRVGLALGEFELVIHEGKIQFIDFKPTYRVDFRKPENGTSEPRIESIRLHEAIRFVLRLEPAIVKKVGRFGHVQVKVRDGLVSDWHFAKRYRYTG